MLGCVVCGHCEQTPAKTASSVQLGKMVLGVVGDDQVCCSSFAFTKDIPENDWFPPHTHTPNNQFTVLFDFLEVGLIGLKLFEDTPFHCQAIKTTEP